MREELEDKLTKFVMEKADKYYSDDFPIQNIEIWISEFFDQYQPDLKNRSVCDAIEDNEKIKNNSTLSQCPRL